MRNKILILGAGESVKKVVIAMQRLGKYVNAFVLAKNENSNYPTI